MHDRSTVTKTTILVTGCAAIFLIGSLRGQPLADDGDAHPRQPRAAQPPASLVRAPDGREALTVAPAGIRENTYVWVEGVNHSGWKALTNYPSGHVIVGTKFFQASATDTYVTGFNDYSQHQWTRTHPTAQHGFTQLQTFWKSFTSIGAPSNPSGYFIATTGTLNGVKAYYTLQIDKAGERTLERFGPLDASISQFGGACQAVDGGYIAVGTDNGGDIAIVKFKSSGELDTFVVLPISGFGWTVQPASGGGYVIGSTNRRATRVDSAFNVVWSRVVDLPVSPDTSAYTYSEFEEIVPLENTGTGFVMTGSVFSNQTSGVYSARLNWDGTVPWSKVNDTSDTSQTGTPVAWANSAVELFDATTDAWNIFFTWRKGPVSAGGTLFFERMNPATGMQLQLASLLNAIPVQEAFTVRQPFVNRIIIAGTRGGYDGVYSYAIGNLPQ